ncbi:TonB-dependent siderophore receptor [Paucibacter sp. KBW04]|uniref:TonB-dependent siderophore receptor n=1 Tax=Paucibacter sp. KBW04 TaxID=2153361 RepID=UPI0018CC7033|nr:TonB-dependent siderophore receptor [Paucibacter sp. KBW04]
MIPLSLDSTRPPIGLAALLLLAPALACAHEAAPAQQALPRVEIEGNSSGGGGNARIKTLSATGMALSLLETPQSLSLLPRERLEDFRLVSVSEALAQAPGVLVNKFETDRVSYAARGFDLIHFQLDGLGLPLSNGDTVEGDLDTALYERIEVLRGAGGLLTGTGNPSATLNFVRKRPLAETQTELSLSLGSWQDRRLVADVSSPLNPSGSLRGRFVAAAQDKHSYLDRYQLSRRLGYGVLEAKLSPSTLLNLGFSEQRHQPKAPLWGSLPLKYSDGTPTHYPVSASTATDWSFWNTRNRNGFAELTQDLSALLGQGWNARAAYTQTRIQGRSKLFYVYGEPDPVTELGLHAYPSNYSSDKQQESLDLRLSGPWTWLGRQHELVLGANAGRASTRDLSMHGNNVGAALPPFDQWHGQFPEPPFTELGGGSDLKEDSQSLYLGARLKPLDSLSLILGANYARQQVQGSSYGEKQDRQAGKTSPYLGAVLALSPQLSAYASHAQVFKPQSQLNAQLQRLAPVQGSNSELGLKSELLNQRLLASLALFRATQANLATPDGRNEELGIDLFRGEDTRSQGLELELDGRLATGWQIQAGYTQLALKNAQGQAQRLYMPRRLLRLGSTLQPSWLPGLKLGAQVAWQSETRNESGYVQQAYGLLDLMAAYQLSERWRLAVNLNNATDQRHIASLQFGQGYYAAPRNASLTLSWSL